MHPFTETIALWYEKHGRSLPWRVAPDAYSVWLSEVILQQTTVKQGTDYYLRFLQQFPTVEALAAATEDEVLRLWQGLGYYSRARNLHAAARQVVSMGGFPTTYKEIRTLRGVGDYTAAAIASLAFGEPCAVVDGNVYRVLSRYFGLDTPIDTTAGRKAFAELADEVLDRQNPARHNQALMDFGATQCLPRNPDCMVCPLAAGCAALAEGRTAELPVKSRRIRPVEVNLCYVLLHTPSGLFLRQRPKRGIWGGLWEIVQAPDVLPQCNEPQLFIEGCGEGLDLRPLGGFRHQLTHRTIVCQAYESCVAEGTDVPGYTFVSWDGLDRYGLPRLIELIIEKWKNKTSE